MTTGSTDLVFLLGAQTHFLPYRFRLYYWQDPFYFADSVLVNYYSY